MTLCIFTTIAINALKNQSNTTIRENGEPFSPLVDKLLLFSKCYDAMPHKTACYAGFAFQHQKHESNSKKHKIEQRTCH